MSDVEEAAPLVDKRTDQHTAVGHNVVALLFDRMSTRF